MTRSVKAAQYERTSRLRKVYDVQANMLGWTKLDVLSTYLTGENELIVFDKDERRLTGSAAPLPAEVERALMREIVAPANVPAEELGLRWQKARQGIHRATEAGGSLDLSVGDRGAILSNLETVASSILRAIEVIRDTNGPDWRERIGLIAEDS